MGIQGTRQPSFKHGRPWVGQGTSLGLEEVMEMDEAMKWVMERGGVKMVVVKRDALRVTLKKVQTQLLVSEKEVARFKGTQT